MRRNERGGKGNDRADISPPNRRGKDDKKPNSRPENVQRFGMNSLFLLSSLTIHLSRGEETSFQAKLWHRMTSTYFPPSAFFKSAKYAAKKRDFLCFDFREFSPLENGARVRRTAYVLRVYICIIMVRFSLSLSGSNDRRETGPICMIVLLLPGHLWINLFGLAPENHSDFR